MDTMQNTWGKFQDELRKTPKAVGCLVCGFRTEDEIEIDEFQENGCPDCSKKEHKYEGKIRFTTDKELTERELQQLIFAIEVQIEEPTNSNGDDEEFTTNRVLVELEPVIKTTKHQRFKKMMGEEINCWSWNFHSALDYVASIVISGKVVLTFDTDLEKVAKGFDTTDHNGEDIYGLFLLFLQFTPQELDLDALGIHEDALSMHDLTEEDLVEMFNDNPVEVARSLRDAQREFQPKYSN